MAHTAETYREAAGEMASLARDLHSREQYAVAHYLAGLAVECVLRAYRVRRDPQFDSRHDIIELVKEAKFYDFVPDESQAKVTEAVHTVARRWSNDHRYRPARM